ncbi:Patatin [Variovorax sp. UMC13]|nr:Patatin [Variovorax sp. UMC13]
MPAAPAPAVTGLLLTGGGARAAYQVGVLEAIAALRREAGAGAAGNPFPIITGTSAGAINAAALACRADDFDGAVAHMVEVWGALHAHDVYRTDTYAMLDAAARWRLILGIGQLLARWLRLKPRSLLDNAPLGELLQQLVHFERLPGLMRDGHLDALAVTASSYSSGEHVTFFESRRPMQPWTRSQRVAVADRITHAHLLASSAIPFVFPAAGLPMRGHTEYFGDGSMRQTAPTAAAIHLGAERILAIGAGRMHEPFDAGAPTTFSGEPTLAQIAGHAMSSIFLDALAVDVERALRINDTLALIPPEARARTRLRPIELLLIAPSERIDAIAARHTETLPRAVRRLLASGTNPGEGGAPAQSAALASYLLFEPGFTRELMALGRADAMRQREAICGFFGWAGGRSARSAEALRSAP